VTPSAPKKLHWATMAWKSRSKTNRHKKSTYAWNLSVINRNQIHWPAFVHSCWFYLTNCNLMTKQLDEPTAHDKKLSYRRETARQLPTSRGRSPPVHSPSGYTYAYGRIQNPQQTYVKRTLRWIAHSRSFKVILIGAGRNPERCVVVMCN